MAIIRLKLDVTGIPEEELLRSYELSPNKAVQLVIEKYKPEAFEGYENFETHDYYCGGEDRCIILSLVRCKKIKTAKKPKVKKPKAKKELKDLTKAQLIEVLHTAIDLMEQSNTRNKHWCINEAIKGLT